MEQWVLFTDEARNSMADFARGIAVGFVAGIGRFADTARAALIDAIQRIGQGLPGVGVGLGVDVSRAFGGFATKGKTAAYSPMMGAGQSLMDYIKSASFGGISQAQLAEWMAKMGFDAETIAAYRDLHKMRGQYGFTTREASLLHRRRTILTGGDWTGGGLKRNEGMDWLNLLNDTTESAGRGGLLDGWRGRGGGATPISAGAVSITAPTVTVGKFAPDMTVNTVVNLNGRNLARELISDPVSVEVLFTGLSVYAARKMSKKP
jgi:hypothetical protein